MTHRKSPRLNIVRVSLPGTVEASKFALHKDVIWLISRMLRADMQTVPNWPGFVSETGSTPDRLTSLDYYPVIFHPITEYSTVQECLRYAEKATDEVGQFWVYSTFDLGVCMKAFPLIWNFPEKFNRHIVMVGTFHLTMGY